MVPRVLACGFHPRPLPGSGGPVQAAETAFYYIDDPQMGWGQRSQSGVEIHEIEFDHEEILREPYVHPLGEQLEACIRRLDKRSAESAFQPPEASLISSSSG